MEVTTKICTKCQEVKPISGFYKDKRIKCGLQAVCKKCNYKGYREWYDSNRVIVLEYKKQYHQDNKEHYRELNKKWRIENSDYDKERHKKNRNKERDAHLGKLWRIKNIDKVKAKEKKRRENPVYHLSNNISRNISHSLKNGKNGLHWETLVNFTTQDLIIHLEKQFTDGMGWVNMGKWHIHHKLPVSWWQFETPQDREFKQCWSLANLQPLWAFENISKSNRVA